MNTLARGLSSQNPAKWFADNRVNLPNMKEVIWEPLYDTVTYPTAGGNLTFFQDQIGKNGKTLVDTNMELDGQLSKGKAFLVTGIQIAFYSALESDNSGTGQAFALSQEYENLSQSGHLIFRIQSKEYLRQGPLGKFPPVERIGGDVATWGQNATQNNIQYTQLSGREFSVRGLLLESNQNFSISLNDLPALVGPNPGRIMVTLNGFSARNAQ
jgi:hypothetical protein